MNDSTAPSADTVLEMPDTLAGSVCALLTPAIKATLRELQAGQVVEVRVTDPTARADIESWCRLAGHDLLAVIEEPQHQLRCFIRKKAG